MYVRMQNAIYLDIKLTLFLVDKLLDTPILVEVEDAPIQEVVISWIARLRGRYPLVP